MSRVMTRRVALVLVTILSFYGRSAAADPPGLPESRAGARVAAFLATLNGGDRAALERYFSENQSPDGARRTPAERATIALRVRDDVGTVQLRRVETVRDESITILVEGSKGQWLRLRFDFQDAAPHALTGIAYRLVPAEEAGGPSTPRSPQAALEEIRASVAERTRNDAFSGVVLVAKDGKPLLLKAWGNASKEHDVANRPDTKFNLGSINKLFTRIAVGQLAAAGRLSLDDTVGKWLPEYPNAQAREQVTVRMLLEMTSGIGDFFGPAFDATPKNRFRTNRDLFATFADRPLLFEPGTDRRYSNGGFVVLGEIVAAASGQGYYDYVQEHVFAPAAMNDTAWYEADAIVPNLAEGYTRNWDGSEHDQGPRRRNLYTRPARGSAAGGGYSTAEDLLRFTNALLADRLLPVAWTEWVLGGPEPVAGAAQAPAAHTRGGLAVAGGAPGINAAVELDLEAGTAIIVLSNYDPPAAVDVGREIRRILGAVVWEKTGS